MAIADVVFDHARNRFNRAPMSRRSRRLAGLQVDSFIADAIERRYYTSVRLEAALRHDELREFRGDIDIRQLHRSSGHDPAASRTRRANDRGSGRKGRRVVVASSQLQSLRVGEIGKRNLTDGLGLPVAE